MENLGLPPSEKLCLDVKLWKITGANQESYISTRNHEETASVGTNEETEINYG